MDELYSIGGELITLADEDQLIQSALEAERIAKAIIAGKKVIGNIDPKLTRLVADKLAETVKMAFTDKNVAFGTPDYAMREQLTRNAFHFAGAKNHQQIISMSKALQDKDGKVRKWKAFRDETEKINKIYNESWLRTEYETALSSAQNAARWSEWKSREDVVNLTYDAVNDELTRHSHKALDGITKPITDPFWNTHYPPNGWRCRCGVMVSTKKASTTEIPNTAIPSLFKTNMAKYGILFPKKHPYFINSPNTVRAQADLLYNEYEFDSFDDDYIKDSKDYPEIGFDKKSGGYIVAHKNHQKRPMKSHIAAVSALKKKGERIVLIDDKRKHNKVGDVVRNGEIWEVKSINSKNYKNAIVKAIYRSRGQSNKVVIHITGEKDADSIINGIEWSFGQYDHHQTIDLIINKKVTRIDRGDTSGRWREGIKKA